MDRLKRALAAGLSPDLFIALYEVCYIKSLLHIYYYTCIHTVITGTYIHKYTIITDTYLDKKQSI